MRLHIPATVEQIDVAFFQLLPNLQNIEVAAQNQTYRSENGILLDADDKSLLLVPEGMEGQALLPDSVATVPACVLSRCTKLSAATVVQAEGSKGGIALTSQDGIIYTADKKVLLAAPAGLGASVRIAPECEQIAEGAFQGNKNLKTIIAEGNMGSVFKGDVTTVPVPVDSLYDGADESDSSKMSVSAFEQEVVGSATVVTSDKSAWEAAGFENFATPANPGDEAQADGFAYTLLDDFTLSIRWAGEGAAPEELRIPQFAAIDGVQYAVSTIERDAFKGQESIRALDIPEGVAVVGDSAFSDCVSLESMKLAGSVIELGASAFAGCTALAETDLGGGLRTIGEAAFEGTSLANVVLPVTVQVIGARAFAANAELAQVLALANIDQIDPTALADCTGVEIYTPYREDDAYAWRAGVPATGNHLMPYGVSLSQEPLMLNQSEQANLLDGGYLEAAGSVSVDFSYNAAPISVDPSSGLVSAKQTGKTTVTATLKLGERSLASASRSVVVALSPQPETEESDEHDHEGEDGEEDCVEGIDDPEVSYKDQLFEEGDYYTSGNFAHEEKVINRSVALSDMDAGISPLSLDFEASHVDSYSGTHSPQAGSKAKMNYSYDAYTRTLTISLDGTSWHTTSKCGGSVACGADGHGYAWRKSRNKLNAVRKLVLENWDHKNPAYLFSKMRNLEEVEIKGKFFGNSYTNSKGVTSTSGVTTVDNMFEDCPQLRVIPSNMVFPSTVTSSESLFGFSTFQFDTSTKETSWTRLTRTNQLQPRADGVTQTECLWTAYLGSDATVKKQLAYSTNTSSDGHYRDLVTSYHTVTFDNQGGTGGHQTVGESSSASTKTYTIKVPTGARVPELADTPTYYVSGAGYWTFGGYVDNLNNAPKEYVGDSGYPTNGLSINDDRKGIHPVTTNMTLKAFWYHKTSFYSNGGAFRIHESGIASGTPSGTSTRAQETIKLAKGYSINTVFNLSNAPSIPSTINSVTVFDGSAVSMRYYTMKEPPLNGDRPFRGYTTGTTNSTTNFKNTAFFDASCKPTSAKYNEPKDFYAMWGYYTINVYSNVEIEWYTKYMKWQAWNGVEYGTRQTGKSTANYQSPYTITDAYGYNWWGANFQVFNSDSISANNSSDGDWPKNYRDVCMSKIPAYHTLKEVRLGSATGTIIPNWNGSSGRQYTLSSNVNVYLIFNDNTPNDTIKWVANGGYLNGNKSTTEKSDTVRRGNKATAPTIARDNTSNTRYTFLGWYNSNTKVCGAGGQVTANGNATYTAKWKTEYKITWNTGQSGAYWGNNTSDTAAKEFWVESGGAVAAPTAPKKTATSDTRWTWSKWNATVVTPATGPASYTGVWMTEYKTIWKLGSTEAYWNNNKSDKADREKWIKSGDKPTQPATPKRDAVAQYTYAFNSWNGITSTVTAPATYTAVWDSTINKYETVWDVNTGYWGSNKADTAQKKTGQLAYGTVLTGPQVGSSIVSANKVRYTFVGWSTNKNADPDNPSQYAKQISVTGANTYYAIYAPVSYTIKLMKNDGSDDTTHGPQLGTVAAKYDRDWTIGAGHVPNRRGYYFIGWDTDPSYVGTTPKYPMAADENGAFHDATFKGNLIGAEGPAEAVLYAVWTESSYTIAFHENWEGAEEVSGQAPDSIKPLYSANVTIPGQNTMKRRGWYFTGWNTRADGTGVDYKTGWVRQFVGHTDFSDAQVRGCTVDLYAQWEPNSYFVFFEPNTNDEWSDQGFDTLLIPKWGDTVTIETEFSRPGYEFVGWSFDRVVPSDDAGIPKVDFHVGDTFTNLTDQRNGVVRLYAQWKGAPYQIVFDANADGEHKAEPGEEGPMAPLDMFLGVGRNLPKNTFVCPGFTFKGWNTEADGTGEAYANGALVQDIPGIKDGKVTLYAQWSAIISMTSPINAHIEVWIDGMEVKVFAVKPGSPQDAIESQTRGKLFVESMVLTPNLDPDNGMARIFPVDGAITNDSWEDFTLEFTALNSDTGKQVKSSVDFGNGFAFLPGQRNNYYVPAYDSATDTPGQLSYKLNMTVPEDAPVRYSEEPVQVGTLVFTCALAE